VAPQDVELLAEGAVHQGQASSGDQGGPQGGQESREKGWVAEGLLDRAGQVPASRPMALCPSTDRPGDRLEPAGSMFIFEARREGRAVTPRTLLRTVRSPTVPGWSAVTPSCEMEPVRRDEFW
jgi:hypothetical protein